MIDLTEGEETPKCRSCGKWTKHKVELGEEDQPAALLVRVCDNCFEEMLRGQAEWTAEFNALLADGVDREEANEIIIDRINLRDRIETSWRPTDKEI